MKVGDTVYVKHNPANDREYNSLAQGVRAHGDRMLGVVVDYFDAHGFGFRVRFMNGEEASYDPDELTVITQDQWML